MHTCASKKPTKMTRETWLPGQIMVRAKVHAGKDTQLLQMKAAHRGSTRKAALQNVTIKVLKLPNAHARDNAQ
ncbi:hypothetical protein NDU88_009758 [Pleurodeles waltl]|uniref:Uncharacterized protein n=1 Tax=Pleurodeles waltl TaxID=8319 RepID=A0AAV7PT10_PLEWA|nr:hypothetical protein NDU88_009758 [Pleurodeles waltl]